MANVKISELPVAASVDGASSFPVVEGGVTKQVTFTGMLASPSLFASGMATFFATPSSANLRAALTDETGTGAAVFADSPTLSGPTVSSGSVTFSGTAQRITGDFSNATLASRVAFQTSTTNGATSVSVLPNGSSTEANVAVFANSSPTNSAVAVLAMTSTDARVLSGITGSGTYVPLTLHTGGAERVRVDTSGNVGIGTSSPDAKLDVVGGINLSDSVYLKEDGYLYSYKGGTINQGRAGVGCFGSTQVLTFITATNERMRIDASGNVGIGTSSPSEKLNVQGAAAGSAFAVRFSNTSSTANSAAVLSLDPGNNGFNVRDGQIHAINNGANQISLAFFTSSAATPAEAMRLDASGNFIAKVNSSAPSLGTNSTMSFELTSNTSLKIVVRGSDGVTRSVSLTLA